MNAVVFYFVVAGIAGVPISASSRIGPLTEEQCTKVKNAIPELSGHCKKVVAMTTCGLDGRPGTYTVCPVFED